MRFFPAKMYLQVFVMSYLKNTSQTLIIPLKAPKPLDAYYEKRLKK